MSDNRPVLPNGVTPPFIPNKWKLDPKDVDRMAACVAYALNCVYGTPAASADEGPPQFFDGHGEQAPPWK